MTTADWSIAVCGLNCAKCDLMAQGQCQGCRGPSDQHWSADCGLRLCATGRGHTCCFECADFPCDQLQAFASDGHEHHRLAVEHLKRMRAIGLEAWLEEQEKPVFCPGWPA